MRYDFVAIFSFMLRKGKIFHPDPCSIFPSMYFSNCKNDSVVGVTMPAAVDNA